MAAIRSVGFVLFLFLVVAFTSEENTLQFDDHVWQQRAVEAKAVALQAYDPNPESVMDHLNGEVHRATDGTNSTRRGLQNDVGSCMATNPIDQCWRCQSNWAENRMKLADCAIGFGQNATGGKGGKIYEVTDPSDNDLLSPKNGTLRHAVIQNEPLWIIFQRDMVIKLSEELIMTSDKTIDGRGAQVHIAGGAGFTLQFINNVIIHNIHISDIKAGNGGLIRDSVDHYGQRTRSDGDGISLFGATNVWIDHVSLSNCEDGLIDAVQASTAVTISNCHFTHQDKAMLFGANDSTKEDEIMQITVAFNHFGQGIVQRMPRVRWGFFHVVNNDYTQWQMYAIGGSMHPTILSQGNRFVAPEDAFAKEVTKRADAVESDWKNWVWRSDGDLLMNGAVFTQSGDPNHVFPSGVEMIKPKPGSFVDELTRFAGALKCIPGQQC